MATCERCDITFKHNWRLQRHLRRKRPCGGVPSSEQNELLYEQNNLLDEQNNLLDEQNNLLDEQNNLLDEQNTSKKCPTNNTTCLYCLQTFSRKDSLERHHKLICKYKIDIVRCLERKLEIEVELRNDNVCRFCNKGFTKKCSLGRNIKICNNKKDYIELLESRLRIREKNSKTGHIYVVRLREHEKSNEPIYKVGMTKQGVKQNGVMKRLSGYPKGTKVYELLKVDDCRSLETEIKQQLKRLTKQRTDLGCEYFEGDIYEVKFVIRVICGYDT
jgi:hypothetical protein